MLQEKLKPEIGCLFQVVLSVSRVKSEHSSFLPFRNYIKHWVGVNYFFLLKRKLQKRQNPDKIKA